MLELYNNLCGPLPSEALNVKNKLAPFAHPDELYQDMLEYHAVLEKDGKDLWCARVLEKIEAIHNK